MVDQSPGPKKRSSIRHNLFRHILHIEGILDRSSLRDRTFSRAQIQASSIRSVVLGGHLRSLQVLLEDYDGPFPNTEEPNGTTALHHAISSENLAIVEALVEFGMKLNIQTRINQSPLRHAVLQGNAAIVRLLLEHGAYNRCQRCRGGDLPLHGDLRLEPEASQTSVNSKAHLDYEERPPLLHIAVSQGEERGLEIATILVEHNIPLWITNSNGEYALDLAYASKSLAMSSISIDRDKWRSVAHAASENYIPAVWTLLKEGCDPNFSSNAPIKYTGKDNVFKYNNVAEYENGELPPGLWWACRHNNIEMAKLLLEHGADPSYRRRGSNLLHATMESTSRDPSLRQILESNRLRLLETLLPLVEGIYHKNWAEATPLSLAVTYDSALCVRLLLERAGPAKRSVLSFKTTSGRNLLHLVRSVEVAKLLHDATIVGFTATDSLGDTPFLASIEKGSVELVDFLGSRSSFTELNSKGQNALQLAVELSVVDVVNFLLQKEISVFQCDNVGDNSIDYALKTTNLNVMQSIWSAAMKQANPGMRFKSIQSLCHLRRQLKCDWENQDEGVFKTGILKPRTLPPAPNTDLSFFDRVITPPYLESDLRIPLLVENETKLGSKTWQYLLESLEKLELSAYLDMQSPEISSLRLLGIFTKVLHLEKFDFQIKLWETLRKKLSKFVKSIHPRRPNSTYLIQRATSLKNEIERFFPDGFLNGGNLLRHRNAQCYSAAITNRLLKSGAPVNSKDSEGMTALHYAMSRDYVDFNVVATLLKSGANIAAVNNKGQTPVDCAAGAGSGAGGGSAVGPYYGNAARYRAISGSANNKSEKKRKTLAHIQESSERLEGGDDGPIYVCPDNWTVDSMTTLYNDLNPAQPSYSYSYSYSTSYGTSSTSYSGGYSGSSSGGYSSNYSGGGYSGGYSGGDSGNSGSNSGYSAGDSGTGGGHSSGDSGGYGGDGGGYGGDGGGDGGG